MGLITSKDFRDGQRRVPSKQLNDLQKFSQQVRRGIAFQTENQDASAEVGRTGIEMSIDSVPILYRVTAVDPETGASSSSSSASEGERSYSRITVKQVDASNGDTSGPALVVSQPETS